MLLLVRTGRACAPPVPDLPQNGRDLQELHHVEPPLATFVLGHKRLRPTELVGHPAG